MQVPLQAKNDAKAVETGNARTVARKRVLIDNRPEVVAQRKLAEAMNNSPRGLQQNALSDAMHNSQRMVAQRQKMNAIFSAAAEPQRVGAVPAGLSHSQREERPNNTGLPNQLKAGIESLSGLSMDHVKVRYNSDKPAQLQAHAYARGNEIHLGADQERHLPHEAWHVVQQAQGRVDATRQMRGGVAINHDQGLEQEADTMGARAARWTQAGPAPVLQSAPAGGTDGAVLQRFQAQIIAAENDKQLGIIADILLSGRTPSPYSATMGAHSTAWTVHTDAIRRQLQGRTFDEGWQRMVELYLEEMASPQVILSSLHAGHVADAEPGMGLREALTRVQTMGNVDFARAHEADKPVLLEDFIDAYLDFVNRLPLSTVASGKKSGNDEGSVRQPLIAIEGGAVRPSAEVRAFLARLFAVDTPAAFVRDMPKQSPAPVADVWAVGLHTFLRNLRHAYPRSWTLAGLDHGDTLRAFLRSLSPSDVPADILERINKLGGPRGSALGGPAPFLAGGTGDFVGGGLAVQVRFSPAGIVDAVRFDGRTPSPFVGSMGAHSTAWVAHLDAVRTSVAGKTLVRAVEIMLHRSRQAQRSMLLGLAKMVRPDQARLLADSQVELAYYERLVQMRPVSDLLLRMRLRQLIAAYLQFENALPLHTSHAASTAGQTEGHYRQPLLAYEAGKSVAFKVLNEAFWKLYDPNSVEAFINEHFAQVAVAPTANARPSRAAKTAGQQRAAAGLAETNRQEEEDREAAYQQKPLDPDRQAIIDALHANAPLPTDAKGPVDSSASISLPRAMALASFLKTMARAYPSSFATCWDGLPVDRRRAALHDRFHVDGHEVLDQMNRLPAEPTLAVEAAVEASGAQSMQVDDGTAQGAEDHEPAGADMSDADAEQVVDGPLQARIDGVSSRYRIGHASGLWNACLIFSLLRHALGRDATDAEVDAIRGQLVHDHPAIALAEQINIYSPAGHAVIQAVEAIHHVRLNVAVVTTRDAPVVPVTAGDRLALLYLMPGHFVPCWPRE